MGIDLRLDLDQHVVPEVHGADHRTGYSKLQNLKDLIRTRPEKVPASPPGVFLHRDFNTCGKALAVLNGVGGGASVARTLGGYHKAPLADKVQRACVRPLV
jgi:hypothetical protein